MTEQRSTASYFARSIQISAKAWRVFELETLSRTIAERGIPSIIFYRQLSLKLNQIEPLGRFKPVHAGHLNLFAILQKIYRYIIDVMAESQSPGVLQNALRQGGFDPAGTEAVLLMECFVQLFPPDAMLYEVADAASWISSGKAAANNRRMILRELLLIRVAAENPAIDSFRSMLDDRQLAKSSP